MTLDVIERAHRPSTAQDTRLRKHVVAQRFFILRREQSRRAPRVEAHCWHGRCSGIAVTRYTRLKQHCHVQLNHRGK
jgi:hypothetical protein